MSVPSSVRFPGTPPFSEAALSSSSFEEETRVILHEALMESLPGAMSSKDLTEEIKIIFETVQEGLIGTPTNPVMVRRKIYNALCDTSRSLPRSFIVYNDPSPCVVIFLNRHKIPREDLLFGSDEPPSDAEISSEKKRFKQGRLFYINNPRCVEKVVVATQKKDGFSQLKTKALQTLKDFSRFSGPLEPQLYKCSYKRKVFSSG